MELLNILYWTEHHKALLLSNQQNKYFWMISKFIMIIIVNRMKNWCLEI